MGTIAAKLQEHGYELLHHYVDKRVVGYRHKLEIGIPGAAYHTLTIDPEITDDIVHEFFPEAERIISLPSAHVTYTWTSESSSITGTGTTFIDRRRADYKREYKKG